MTTSVPADQSGDHLSDEQNNGRHSSGDPSGDPLAAARGQFHPAGIYLNTATCGLLPDVAAEALRNCWDELRAGEAQGPLFDPVVERARLAYARLVGADAGTVAIGNQVSVLIGMIAASLPTGGEIVVAEGDFTSVTFPFAASGRFTVREVPLADLADAIGQQTTAVAVSAAQSADGTVADLPAILAACAANGALSVVDLTQAAGWLTVPIADIDVTVCGAYKWLLNPRGTAFLTVRPEVMDSLIPIHAGWYAGGSRWESIYGLPLRLADDARRFDISPAWPSWVGAAPCLELLADLGADIIGRHDIALADTFRAGLDLPPAGSAIVSIALDDAAAERVAAADIRGAMRAGKLRLSFHLHNTQDDVDATLAAIRG